VVAIGDVWQGGGVSLWRMMWCAVAMGVVAEPPVHEMAVDVGCLAHHRCSRCEVVVTKGGDSDRESGGRRRKVVFGYELCLYLVICVWLRVPVETG
jgi:hypothetical protein